MFRNFVALCFGLLLIGTIVVGGIELIYRPRTQLTRVIVGTHDEVYYYHSATKEEAASLGEALRQTGFFNDRGTTVILSKGTAGTSVSFALNDGAWDHPDTVYTFEEIGRRVAASIGGFPIKVRLIDSKRILHKELNVGKIGIGTKDVVYYFGNAAQSGASSLGDALRAAGYFQDHGAAVVLSKDAGTTIAFVVDDGVWDREDAVRGFQNLVRAASSSVGGLPVALRFLNSAMEPKRTVLVR